ncbi:hypothetical protein L7P85_10710, partial [Escherichia coli]
GPDPRNFNQRVSLGRNDLLIRTFLSLTISHSLQVFIALLRKITIRKEAGQGSLFHTSTNPQQVKAVCSNCS